MNRMRFLSNWIGWGMVISAMLQAWPAAAGEGKAFVRAFRGKAEFSTGQGEWLPLRVGMALTPGSSVKSGFESQVDLFLGDNGPTIRLLQETTLGLDKLNIDRTGIDVVIETFLDLRTGTIQGNVKRLAEASKYEVKTPFTVCAVKGSDNVTEYEIRADGIHYVKEGSLLVLYSGISSVIRSYLVSEGQTFVPPADPSAPGASPIVRPTRRDDFPDLVIDGDRDFYFPPPPPLEPIQFISPGTGVPVGDR